VVVVDYAHDNALFIEELNVLFSKIVARGFSYEIVFDEESADADNSSSEDTGGLIDKLRYAKALVLPVPRTNYTPEEITEIERFVAKGGRLLIVGDPTRTVAVDALNSIAGSFDVIFVNDYLYSLENNDNNYRNVVYTNIGDSPLTERLADGDQIVLYSAGSVRAPGNEIILGDETTHSSVSEGGRSTLASAALTTDNQVLAVGDLTFFNEPHSTAESNGMLISNIADFLTGGARDFELKDFPYFFNQEVDIVFEDTLVFNSQFDDSVVLKETLEALDHNVTFTESIGEEDDVIFVGRFDDTSAVQAYLEAANITVLDPDEQEEEDAAPLTEAEQTDQRLALIRETTPGEEERFVDGRIQIKGVGDLERGGSTLFYRHKEDGRNILIILSDTPDTNADAFELLLDNELADCLVSPNIAVCQTEEPGGELPPSLRSNRIDKILIVSDNDGRQRYETAQTSALEYRDALSDTYKLRVWFTAENQSPDIDELLDFDAIIWSTGNYWDDSISEEDVALLTKYIELGGNLIISGASVAFDWDHTDFLENVVHADYLNFAAQSDLELVLADHPIANNFEEGALITFIDTELDPEEPLEPDVVTHTPDARVIFQRGPTSEESGSASVIAYEDKRAKVAYFAFPVYLLPGQERALLINNTIDWFSKKALDLPDDSDYEPFDADDEEEEAGETEEGAEEEPTDEETGDETGEDDGGGEDEENGTEDENGTGDGNGEEG
jgi:hypothetical protein